MLVVVVTGGGSGNVLWNRNFKRLESPIFKRLKSPISQNVRKRLEPPDFKRIPNVLDRFKTVRNVFQKLVSNWIKIGCFKPVSKHFLKNAEKRFETLVANTYVACEN